MKSTVPRKPKAPKETLVVSEGLLSKFNSKDLIKAGTLIGALLGTHFWGQLNNDSRAERTNAKLDTAVTKIDSTVILRRAKQRTNDSLIQWHNDSTTWAKSDIQIRQNDTLIRDNVLIKQALHIK
jgi:hypothetical protein